MDHVLYLPNLTGQKVDTLLADLPMLREWDFAESTEKEIKIAWRCRMCGHIHYGQEPPEACPYCFFPKTMFKKVWPVSLP